MLTIPQEIQVTAASFSLNWHPKVVFQIQWRAPQQWEALLGRQENISCAVCPQGPSCALLWHCLINVWRKHFRASLWLSELPTLLFLHFALVSKIRATGTQALECCKNQITATAKWLIAGMVDSVEMLQMGTAHDPDGWSKIPSHCSGWYAM
jgi:hypothetical protein